MARYAVQFEFSDAESEPRHELGGDTLERAKLEAAILYLVADFATPPVAYAILRDGAAEAYRYPEAETEFARARRRQRG